MILLRNQGATSALLALSLLVGLGGLAATGDKAHAQAAASAPAPLVPPRPNPSDVMKNWPAYPGALRHTGREGTVLLQVRIDAEGVPREIGIARSSNVALLDESAVLAVRRWRFSPATRGGQPVEATVRLPIDFKLKDPPPAAPILQDKAKAAARTPPGKPAQPAKPAAAKSKAVTESKPASKPRAARQAAPREPATAPPSGGRQGLAMPPSLTLPPPQ